MPIGNYCRFIAAALILLNLAIPNACAESPLVLDEGKALELFEKASKSLKAADAQAISARMAENAAVLPANPNFMFDGDNPGSGSREYTAVFEWTTDISGRKGFLRKSAASMRMSTESVVQAKKIDVLIGFKRVFYDARRVEELARATREMASKIKALSNIVRTASRQSEYDRLRLESEFAKAEIAAKSSSEEIALRHCELASLMGLPECGDIELTGEILPSSTTTTGITNINNHPAITKLMSELDRKSFEQKAAERRAIPGIGFKGGIKNLEVGRNGGPYFSPSELSNLREYLLRGGFLLIDDFWGTREWQAFENAFSAVFPEREIVRLPADHEIFRVYYDTGGPQMVPALGNTDNMPERDVADASVHAILDDDGRIMVLINWNTDMGDGWEHTYHPRYPTRFANLAYQLGLNYLIYSMTH